MGRRPRITTHMNSCVAAWVFLLNRKGVSHLNTFLPARLNVHPSWHVHVHVYLGCCMSTCIFGMRTISPCILVYVSWCMFILISGSLIWGWLQQAALFVCVCVGERRHCELLINSGPGPQSATPIQFSWRKAESSSDPVVSRVRMQ